jgi:hypothetical protein
MHNNELHNLCSLPDCNDKMERDHLEDLGLDKRIIKFWKELIAYFPLI